MNQDARASGPAPASAAAGSALAGSALAGFFFAGGPSGSAAGGSAVAGLRQTVRGGKRLRFALTAFLGAMACSRSLCARPQRPEATVVSQTLGAQKHLVKSR